MKNVSKQPVLKLSLCVLLMGLINVSATNSAFAVQNLKQDFLRAVRAKMESTRNPGLSSQYFSVGDPDKLLAGVDQYVSGVAVDKYYLAHFKMAKYLQSFIWVQHPGLGLTQPRYEDAGWGDIASTPQEKRYSGWIILADPPDSLGGTTAFHEAIHAYHFYIRSGADNDDYGAPEAISNDYARLVKSLGVNDTRLEGILEKIRTGKRYEADLESLRQRVKTLREKHEDYVSKQSRLKFAEVLNNIGGRADWDGYDRAVNRAIADAVAGAPQSLAGLREQLEALKKRLTVVEGAIPGFQKLKAKYDEEELTMKLHIAAIQKAINEVSEAKEIVSSLVSIKNSISNNLGEAKKLTAGVDEKTAGLNLIYSAYAVAAMEASDAADEICDYASRAASQPSPPADEIVGWVSESSVLITNAAISLGDSDKEVTAQIKSLDTGISSLRTTLKRFEELSSSRETILAGFDQLKEIKGTLDDAEKDVKCAEEVQAILMTALSGLTQMRDTLGQDIMDLRGEANALAQAVRGRDLQLEADVTKLQARIKAVQNAVVIYLPSLLPEVPELSPDFQEFVAKFKDPTRKRPEFEEKFGLINPAIADGKRAISDAEGAVAAGAFATRNAPANLERARQCYASLKGEPPGEETVAQGPLDGYRRQLKDLEARMDKIEGGIPEFEREKAEYKAKWAEEELTMTLHLAAAQKAWKEVSETNEINEIIVRIAFTKDYIIEKLEEANGSVV